MLPYCVKVKFATTTNRHESGYNMFMLRYIRILRYSATYKRFDTYRVCRDHELAPAKTLQPHKTAALDGDSHS
jgi:hypothetical protein